MRQNPYYMARFKCGVLRLGVYEAKSDLLSGPFQPIKYNVTELNLLLFAGDHVGKVKEV